MAAATSARSSAEGSGFEPGQSSSSLPRRVRAEERQYQSEMMFIGQRCHWHECHREDFLPFTCADCHQTFCSQHFRTSQHVCPTATPTFVVPLCPLCHEPPKEWRRDEDPNVAMNAHLTPNSRTGQVECTAINVNGTIRGTKERRRKRENECEEHRCRKLMVVPITCPSCSLRFCPSHRAPNQHQCAALASTKMQTAAAKKAAPTSTPGSRLLESLATKRAGNRKVDEEAEKTITSTQQKIDQVSNKLSIAKAVNTASTSRKIDKRTKMEKASAVKAMQARHQKGLLTPAEQVKLAEEMAELQMNEKKPDCCIM